MTKRVYEYAKEHDLTSKELLTMAKSKGMEFGSHMSSISEDQEKQLNNIISNKNTKKSEKPETNSKEANKEGSKPSQNTNKKASRSEERRVGKAHRRNEKRQ